MTDQDQARTARGARLLEIEGLRTHFVTEEGTALAVDGVDLHLDAGETLGLVGESGCGKSVAALSILGLVPAPGRVVAGRIRFQGRDLRSLSEDALRDLRGGRIAMVFQEPMTALNPVFPIGEQLVEAIRVHLPLDRRQARERAVGLLARVGFSDPERRMGAYPHELSGGMRQRVLIAMAISCDPSLLIADEPTTALDVTTQAQILDLLRELQAERGMGLLLITHDLAVVAETAQNVAVMYAGRIVEYGRSEAFFERPMHPYSIGLQRALPGRAGVGGRLRTIPGAVPSATRYPSGCRFHTRCALATELCRNEVPVGRAPAGEPGSGTGSEAGAGGDRWAACHHLDRTGEL